MPYILVTFIAAVLFGGLSVVHYGYPGLLEVPWIDCVVRWLIAMGAMLGLLDDTPPERQCRVSLRPA